MVHVDLGLQRSVHRWIRWCARCISGGSEAPGHLIASPESPVDGLQGGQQTDGQDQDVEGQNRGLGQPQEQVLTWRLEPVLAQQEVGDKVSEADVNK